MKKFTADFIYPISSPAIKNGVVVVNDFGKIETLLERDHIEYEGAFESAERLNGIICPGFINTHCHLELSYLKGKINNGSGLSDFVNQLQSIRNNFSLEFISAQMSSAEDEMLQNGIVAVADISNGTSSIEQKLKQRLFYHTYVELFGWDPNKADVIFKSGEAVLNCFLEQGLHASITAHAPYSCSSKLLKRIASHCQQMSATLSIHNQESAAENQLFMSKTGDLAQMLTKFGNDLSSWSPKKMNSLPSYFADIKGPTKTLLVHNTFTNHFDVEAVNSMQIYWCLCPNANRFIENRLAEIPMLIEKKAKITIGTDSLASNHQLSIWSEIMTISEHFPEIELNELLTWATINGAKFMGIDQHFGTIEVGKSPGLIHIEQVERKDSKIKRLA